MQLPLQHQDQYEKGFLQFRTPYPQGFGNLSGQPHLGSDILTPTGTPLFAMFDGTVRFTIGKQGGNTAILTSINPLKEIPCREFEIRYMHLAGFFPSMKAGDTKQVKAGELIGFTGNSGASTAPHLHLDLRPSGTTIHIDNFYDPNTIFELIQRNMTKIPQWFKDNGTDVWAKNKMIRIDQTNLTESDCKEIESLKKATQPADIDVTVYYNRFTPTGRELEAIEQAVRDTVRFYLPFVNLIFTKPQKLNMSFLELEKGLLKDYTPSQGMNVVIAPDKDIDVAYKDNVNGFMIYDQRTAIIKRSLLLSSDSRDRGIINAFACTLQHELCHWFGRFLDMETREDRTHHFDYNFTLANYLPKLAWGLLHDKNFRLTNNI